MSVFTSVSIQQLQAWLQDYPIGEVVDLKGISSGITNTNYFVTTTQSKYVLTLFEHNTIDELPYFIDLMHHLSEHGVPCPDPITNKAGVSLHMLNGKPAVLISCLNGRDITAPNVVHCAEVGRVLAQMHQAGQTFAGQTSGQAHQNPRGADWRNKTAQKVVAHLSADDQKLLTETLAFQAELDTSALPKGIIHADLFRDNVLFDGDKVGGLIDFYYACHDVLAYDLAIVANDWCVQADGQLDTEKVEALLKAYQSVRPFEQAEHAAWNGLLRIAALRFWLSRLYDQIYPQAGELTHAKDPGHFKNILKLRTAQR
ncbi:MAG: homoserine kinase [Methylotenera sp.]|uniref:homoserine kinase n=1 Tax=Methylotenera sp. TaxID=2051956 RepID=UPI000D4C9805|nr:homoserine kinase [Methylotenera sp.]MDP3210843.1 homoserine kinase [Methylotenera sp.]PPC90766.1 MAG: homoserine kinase [Methylotenera sp.]